MDAAALRASARSGREPPDLTAAQRVLWLDARGDWSAAHDLAQHLGGRDGARLHAYLHRVEGDLDNAVYWYRRAGEPVFDGTIAEEWSSLAARFHT
jgi:hypothetical protein